MAKSSSNRGLLYIGFIFIVACVLLFLGGMFAPRAIGFLDGVMCPEGMHLNRHTEPGVDSDGNNVQSTTTVCVGGGSPVDVTPKMLGLLFGLAIVGGIFVFWSVGGIQRVG